MAFHASAPSRVWKFGCRAPRIDVELVERQFSLAHRYYNNLVELERKRRADIDEAVQKHSPILAALQHSIETIAAELREERQRIKDRNQEQCKRTATPEDRDKIEELERRLAEAKAVVKVEREKLWGKPAPRKKGDKKPRRRPGDPIRVERDGGNRAFLDQVARIENAALHRQQQLRGGCGVFWGTYLLCEKAWKQACQDAVPALPHFRRWNGDGTIGVQLQGGLSAADAFAGTDSRLRLVMQAGHKSKRGQNGTAWLRIGSEGRNPIWAQFAFRLDRPLPQNAVIKWAVISRRRYGCRQKYPFEPIYKYHLHLTFSSEDGFQRADRAQSGKVAVNAGWRLLPDGSLRVATWRGDDGKQGCLTISAEARGARTEGDLGRWGKADELRSIRDKLFDEMRGLLGQWIVDHDSIIPDWLRVTCSHLHQWKSPGRLAALIGVGKVMPLHEGETVLPRWRDNRFAGDEEMFALLESWLKQNNHLWQWEANQRRKAVAWRDKLYERLAVDLRRQYRELRIGKIDQKKLAARANPEDAEETVQLVRFHRMIASPGKISEKLKGSFEKENVVVAPAKFLTQRCPYCGCEDRWDAAPAIMHTCAKCTRAFDQDIGHCMNLLSYEPPASGDDVDETSGEGNDP